MIEPFGIFAFKGCH